MRATWLVVMALFALTPACRAQVCPPGMPAAPVYRGTFAPAPPTLVQVHHMKDSKGQDWTHADPAYLTRWIDARNASFKAEADASASKKAENFGLNMAGIKAETKGTLYTNDNDFAAKVMDPPAEEVPIPDPPAARTEDNHTVMIGVLLILCLLLMIVHKRDK